MWFSAKAFWHNSIQYAKSLTILRTLNIVKLLIGFFVSRILKIPAMVSHPFALSVEPSAHCQLKCPECPTGVTALTRRNGAMKISLFHKIINESKNYLVYLNLYLQGEPLLHPQIAEMATRASRHNIYTTISTNGLLLHSDMCKRLVDSALSRIVVSLDGFTQPVYEKYRAGGDVEVVKNGILRLLKARFDAGVMHPCIVVQFLAFQHNMHELPQVKKWCQKAGVDKLEIKTAQINDFGKGSVTPSASLSRYKKNNTGPLQLKGREYNHCWRQWSSAVVSWDGIMAPCCFDKNMKFAAGNVSTLTLGAISNSKNGKLLKKLILTNRQAISICQNCPEGRNFIL